MRFVVGILFAGAALFGQQVQVKTATAHKVELAWNGSAPAWIVERKSEGAVYQKLATVNTTAYEDGKIDAYGTYQYRVRAGEAGKPSNEVTVGPPPAGILKAALAPKEAEPTGYGRNSALALDGNGDAAIAWVWFDPNRDTDMADTEVRFVRWSRAAYKWLDPVKVATIGETASQNVEPVSLAFDAKTGTFGIAHPKAGQEGVTLALSKDGGATWQPSAIHAGIEGSVFSTALAMNSGKLYLAVNCEGSGVRYVTADIGSDATQWQSQAAPPLLDTKIVPSTNVTLVLDGAGKPLVGYVLGLEDGSADRFAAWRPGGGKAVAVMDPKGQSSGAPNLRLAFGGSRLGLLVNTLRDEKDSESGIWYTGSADGSAWSAPVKLPIDGPRSTNAPLALAIDSHGRIAAVFGSNSGSGDTKCDYPVMSRSTDGAAWTTCGVGHWAGGSFSPQPNSINAVFGGNDKLYVVWHETSEQKFGQGLMVWHEK